MTIFTDIMLALQALAMLVGIGLIGKERKPYTRSDAIMNLIMSAIYIWYFWSLGAFK